MPLERYLLAHFAKSQLWHSSGLLFAFFLTETCGLPARTMGLILAGSLLLNGLVDLGLGVRWKDRVTGATKALHLQARAAPLMALFFLLFAATPIVASDWRTGWALATLVGFRVTYPLIDVPQNAMVALLTGSAELQCRLLAWRNMASGLASLSVSLLAAPLLIFGRDILLYLAWAGCLSAFVCAAAWWLGRWDGEGTLQTGRANTPARPDLPFAAVLGALAVMVCAGTAFRAIEPYYAAFAARGTELLVWGAIGTIVSQPLWVAYRQRASATGVLVLAAFVLLLAAAALLGPLRSGPAGAIVAGAGFGIGSGGLWLMLWSAMIACAANGQATRYVGMFTCVSKLSQAGAMLLLGHVLATSSYRQALARPLSPPSLLMTGALALIAATCLTLALGAFRRTASGGRSAMPRPMARTGRVPG